MRLESILAKKMCRWILFSKAVQKLEDSIFLFFCKKMHQNLKLSFREPSEVTALLLLVAIKQIYPSVLCPDG